MINSERLPRDVITVGASAGGIQALTELFAKLPARLPAAIAVVLHRSPHFEGKLPGVLGRRTSLEIVEPEDGAALETGRVYVAPRDQHLILDGSAVRLSRGPKEHRTRPAIDPLFRSAAKAYGPRVTGVLLSGFGEDGVSGLIAITAGGGLSLVQHPLQAIHSTMPKNAIAEDDVDAVLYLDQMADALTALACGEPFEVVANSERAVT